MPDSRSQCMGVTRAGGRCSRREESVGAGYCGRHRQAAFVPSPPSGLPASGLEASGIPAGGSSHALLAAVARGIGRELSDAERRQVIERQDDALLVLADAIGPAILATYVKALQDETLSSQQQVQVAQAFQSRVDAAAKRMADRVPTQAPIEAAGWAEYVDSE